MVANALGRSLVMILDSHNVGIVTSSDIGNLFPHSTLLIQY
jgi:hypothetical protein